MEFEIVYKQGLKRPWLIKRINGEYAQHAHMVTREQAVIVRDLIKRNKLAKSKSFRRAQRRLLDDDEYNGLKTKQRYNNHPCQCRRCK